MTLNTRQTKVVDGAKDLLRRLKNERRRDVRLPNREAKVAVEFGRDGPRHVRGLLTTIKQLTVLAEARDDSEITKLMWERDRLRGLLSEARVETAWLGLQTEASTWGKAAGWLRDQAAVEFIEGKDDQAARVFRRAYHMVKERAGKCQRLVDASQLKKSQRAADGDEYYLILPKHLTPDQRARVEQLLVDLDRGDMCEELLGRGQALVTYPLGVQLQNALFRELGLEGTKMERDDRVSAGV